MRIVGTAIQRQVSSPSGFTRPGRACAAAAPHLLPAFTLIELILVMAILTMAVSVTAPALGNFFRGRALDSEARRLLAMTRSGYNRAISEGIPMDLWIDSPNSTVGLDAEPSFEKEDPRAEEFKVDTAIRIEVGRVDPPAGTGRNLNLRQVVSTASVPAVHMSHPSLPTIRFLPDGSIAETSPTKLQIIARDGSSLWLVQSKDKLNYEIRTSER